MKDRKLDIVHLWRRISIYDDDKAFESFFYLLNMPLIKFCMMYIHQREWAEEIVSDVFAKCWIHRKSLTGIKDPDTYLFVAVKNQSLNHLRKYGRLQLVQLEETNETRLTRSYDPREELEKKELFFKMEQAIEALPQQCRIIFRLIKEDGLKYREVAAILDISPRTVQTQLFRAMKKLSAILSEHTAAASPGKNDLKNLLLLLSIFRPFF